MMMILDLADSSEEEDVVLQLEWLNSSGGRDSTSR